MPIAANERELKATLATYLKAKIRASFINYQELAWRLEAQGWQAQTPDAIKSKLKRGTFSAAFFFAVLAALDVKDVKLEDVMGVSSERR